MSCPAQGVLLALCACLVFVVVLIYVRFVISQRHFWVKGLEHVHLMSLRMPLVLPAYAILSLFVYAFPFYLPAVKIFEAISEGYALICYLKLVLFAVGSEQRARDMIRDSTATGCLCFKYPFWAPFQAHASCLFYVRLGFLQFLFLRPLLFLGGALVAVLGDTDKTTGRQSPAAESLKRAFTVLAVLSLVITLPCILRIYEVFRTKLPDLGLMRKVFFIKGFILLWVIENNIVEFYTDDKGLSASLYSRRVFSIVVLVELCFLSAFLADVFGAGPAMQLRIAELSRSLTPGGIYSDDASHCGSPVSVDSSHSNNPVLSPVSSHVSEEGVVGSARAYSPVQDSRGPGDLPGDFHSSSGDSSDGSSVATPGTVVNGKTVGELSAECQSPYAIKSSTAGRANLDIAVADSSSDASHIVMTVDTLQRKLPPPSACQMLLSVLALWSHVFDTPSEYNVSLVSASVTGLHPMPVTAVESPRVAASRSPLGTLGV